MTMLAAAPIVRPGEPSADDPTLPGWTRPGPTDAERRTDLLLAVSLLVAGVLSEVLYRAIGIYQHPASGAVAVAMVAACTLPQVWRRVVPWLVAPVVAVAFGVAQGLSVPEQLVVNISLFIAVYTVGAWETDRRRAGWVRGAIVVGMSVWLLVVIFRTVTGADDQTGLSRVGAFSPLVAFLLLQVLQNVAYFAAAWGFGDHAWASARERARTRWRTRQLATEQLRAERLAVELERLRIARELHDAVAHHVATMGVQAAAARTLIGADRGDEGLAALTVVEGAARRAVEELAGILHTLRDADDPVDAGVVGVGAVGVHRLDELVSAARAGGLDASLEVVGDPVGVGELVSLGLYRIAQEALTNARKHAGPRVRVQVRLRYRPDVAELEVSDDGGGSRPATRVPSTGLGLTGMRERVASVGGSLTVGPLQRGGWLVRATLPVVAP